jgi:FkbM family methyltransferase
MTTKHNSASRRFQLFLLSFYGSIAKLSIWRTRFGRACFVAVYNVYKRFVEAGDIAFLAQYVAPGSLVIDVGANVGYFSRKFAKWVGPHGRVIAVEPEELNFQSLQRSLQRDGATNVIPLRAVCADCQGLLLLAVNPMHPGDHKLAEEGIPIRSVRIDDLIAEYANNVVSLIKIDVQGAEERVLKGALRTIASQRPNLFVEVDDQSLRAMGSSASTLLGFIAEHGYECYHVVKGKLSAPLTTAEALIFCTEGRYTDFLFLPAPSPGTSSPAASTGARLTIPQ